MHILFDVHLTYTVLCCTVYTHQIMLCIVVYMLYFFGSEAHNKCEQKLSVKMYGRWIHIGKEEEVRNEIREVHWTWQFNIKLLLLST